MADEQNLNNAQPEFDPNFQPQPEAQPPVGDAGDQYTYFDPTQQPQSNVGATQPQPDFSANQDFAFDAGVEHTFDPSAQVPATDTYGAGSYAAAPDAGTAASPDAYGSTDPNNFNLSDPATGVGPAADPSLVPPLDNTGVAAPINTFEEKKTGNKLFLIIAISLVVLLLGVAGFLLYLNYGPNSDSDTSQDNLPSLSTNQDGGSDDSTSGSDEGDNSDSEEQPVIDESLTGGADSISTQARKFNASSTPNEWNLRKFFVPNIDDQSGECLNVSVCGPSVDPDKDGLDNIDEYNFDTDPLKSDTDNDKVADGDELFVYYTDPGSDDSDLDSFTDGQEIAGCFDPSINGAGKKYSSTALAVLEKNTTLYQLHEPTIALMRGAGALSADILGSGVPTEKCDVTSAEDSTETAEDDIESEDTTPTEEGSTNSEIDSSNPI